MGVYLLDRPIRESYYLRVAPTILLGSVLAWSLMILQIGRNEWDYSQQTCSLIC
jgi:hypothetical protein